MLGPHQRTTDMILETKVTILIFGVLIMLILRCLDEIIKQFGMMALLRIRHYLQDCETMVKFREIRLRLILHKGTCFKTPECQ